MKRKFEKIFIGIEIVLLLAYLAVLVLYSNNGLEISPNSLGLLVISLWGLVIIDKLSSK